MTSFRQIEANRRNAQSSTGPKTEDGKRRSRQNAVRHGLCAETVVEHVEDIEDYRGFKAAVIADYDARTAVERELVLRLASLLWRLRRATAIETDLLRMLAETLCKRRPARRPLWSNPQTGFGGAGNSIQANAGVACDDRDPERPLTPNDGLRWTPLRINPARQLTFSFRRPANLDYAIFERLNRYEASLPARP